MQGGELSIESDQTAVSLAVHDSIKRAPVVSLSSKRQQAVNQYKRNTESFSKVTMLPTPET